MTNYIESMMRTAGVEPISETCDMGGGCTGYIYPDFTASKQLEIIKLIASNTDFYINTAGEKWELSVLSEINDEGILEEHNIDFTQALAQLTTELMNANELDKSKVKEILEG